MTTASRAILSLVSAVLLVGALPALAAPASYQQNGKTYYVVDGNDPDLNSGDRVCAAVGLACVGYTDTSTKICSALHPSAAVNASSVNGSKSGYYCDASARADIACKNHPDTCQTCPACNVNADCATQIGDHFAEMYIECAAPAAAAAQQGWFSQFLAFWQRVWSAVWHPGAAAPVQGTKNPREICANGGECKSGNCVRDDGVYRCSCSPIANDYSSCK